VVPSFPPAGQAAADGGHGLAQPLAAPVIEPASTTAAKAWSSSRVVFILDSAARVIGDTRFFRKSRAETAPFLSQDAAMPIACWR
jgi:hypothetical protein